MKNANILKGIEREGEGSKIEGFYESCNISSGGSFLCV